jgi:hypothetical protein
MRIHAALLSLILAGGTALAAAQEGPKTPNSADIYCSGEVRHAATTPEHYVISGPESYLQAWYGQREHVFINRGSSQGVRVGDQYLVTRPVKDSNPDEWFRWQRQLMNAMGRLWIDVGRIRVVHVEPNVSVAEIVTSCDAMQRGDHIRPFAARPAPPLRHEPINPYAPETNRGASMVVLAKDFRQSVGANDVIYINAGSAQGVNTGDYVRIFRYQASRYWKVFVDPHTAHRAYGFGRAPRVYHWNELPRDIAGEGIVLRTSENASTVLITTSVREIYLGYYVELK